MARISIYLPDELRHRMEPFQESVNWSQIAAHAFATKLAEIQATKKVRTMDDVVTRLRASKLQSETEDYRCGWEAGQRWAKRDADWDSLRKLASAEWLPETFAVEDAPAAAGWFHDTLGDDLTQGEVAAFWEDRVAQAMPSNEVVHGFYDGVLAVFEEVKKRV